MALALSSDLPDWEMNRMYRKAAELAELADAPESFQAKASLLRMQQQQQQDSKEGFRQSRAGLDPETQSRHRGTKWSRQWSSRDEDERMTPEDYMYMVESRGYDDAKQSGEGGPRVKRQRHLRDRVSLPSRQFAESGKSRPWTWDTDRLT